jgi:hypothetical protein
MKKIKTQILDKRIEQFDNLLDLLKEANDTILAATAEIGVSGLRIEYRKRLFERIKAELENHGKSKKKNKEDYTYNSSHESCVNCSPLFYLRRESKKTGKLEEAEVIETGVQEQLELLWVVAKMQGKVKAVK